MASTIYGQLSFRASYYFKWNITLPEQYSDNSSSANIFTCFVGTADEGNKELPKHPEEIEMLGLSLRVLDDLNV